MLACIIFLFFVLLLPAYQEIWNAIRSIFTYLICKEIIYNDSSSAEEYSLLVRYLQQKNFNLLRKIVVKKNIDAILSKFNKISFIGFKAIIDKFDSFKYRPEFKNLSKSLTGGSNWDTASVFIIALRNIILEDPTSFDKIQNMVIDKALEHNYPDLVFQLAVASEDMNISYRKLYLTISKFKSSKSRQTFELRFKKYSEIEKLISLSP